MEDKKMEDKKHYDEDKIILNQFESHTKKESNNNFFSNGAVNREYVLEVKNLKKIFGKKEAVKNASLNIKSSEIVGLLGSNGAGKTTIFYMIAGFITPTQGSIFIKNKDITSYPMYKRAQAGIAYLPQEASVFRKLSVQDNIKAVLETRTDLSKQEKADFLEELLVDLGITHIRKSMAFSLSGGERRRTEIARALAISPDFLLLDEPFAGVDPIAIFEIKEIVQFLSSKGIGVLITDHNVRDTLTITDRAYIIHQGQILVEGDKDYIMQDEMAKKVYFGKDFTL